MDKLLDFEPINVRVCKICIKLKYYDLTMISTHAPTAEKRQTTQLVASHQPGQEENCSMDGYAGSPPEQEK